MRGEFLDLSDARLYYYAAGTRGAGNPVVFLHGFPTSGHLWNDVIPLVPPGHRLVVVDLLGFGRSDRPLARAVDIRDHATRIVELLDELRIPRACIVGHGIGGGIAQSLAVRHAERVSHCALIDSVGFDAWPLKAKIGRALSGLLGLLPPAVLVAGIKRELVRGYDDHSRGTRSLDHYLRPFVGTEGRAALVAHLRSLSSRETVELAPRLGGIRVPTAIVCGRHDRVTPLSISRRLHDAISGSTLEVVDGARHFTPEEAPRVIADVLAALLRR